MAKKKSNNYGVAALVLGILGIVFIWVPLFGLVMAILATIFGVKQNKKHNNGTATAGVVLGIIGMSLPLLLLLIGGLSYFGSLDVSNFIPDSCVLDGNLECPAYALNDTDLRLEIRNNLPQSVAITSINIGETTYGETWCEIVLLTPVTIEAGASEEVNSFDASFDGSLCGIASEIGKRGFDLEIYYLQGDFGSESVTWGSITTTPISGSIS